MFKAMRRSVKMMGRDPKQVVVQQLKGFYIPGFPGKPGAMFLGAYRLDRTCGRAIYRTLKKHQRTGAPA